jgi:hypothetical protein
MPDVFQHYLEDVLREVIRKAREARARAISATTSGDDGFARGRAMAYYEVVSHLVNQLDAFQIDRASVGIDPGYDADRDLLSSDRDARS